MNKYTENIHKKTFIADLHCDTIGKILEGADIRKDNANTQIDIPKLLRGSVNLQVFAAWINPKYAPNHCARRAMVLIDSIIMLTKKHEEFTLVKTSRQIKNLKKAKIGILISIEGGDAIEGSLELLRNFYRLGVRIMTLTWNKSNRIGDAALDRTKPHNGLSSFGKDVIHEMGKLKMVIDIAHSSEKTFWDVYENTDLPFVSTHTGAYSVKNNKRNLNDKQIKAIAERRGLIGIFFLPKYISRKIPVRISDVVAHINRIRDVGGLNVIALGSDFDGMSNRVKNLEDAGKLPYLTEALLKSGYKEKEIRKILGENFLNFFKRFNTN